MSKIGRRLAWAVGLLLGPAAFVVWLLRQPMPAFVERDANAVVGVYHVHSCHSHDSRITPQAYIAAAKQMGLNFVVLTDHNAQADVAGGALGEVTVLAAAELSSAFGHVVSLGARAVLPPQARLDPRVLELIDAQDGAAVIAHPSDYKRPWTGLYPAKGGIEIANWSASARRQLQALWPAAPALALAWLIRRPLLLAQVYDRDEAALALWDAPEQTALSGFCAIDAHGWMSPQDNFTGWQLVLDPAPPPATADAAAAPVPIMAALRQGHFFCAAGLLGRAPAFAFAAQKQGATVARHGDKIARRDVDELVVRAPALTVGQTRLVVRCDGRVISDTAATSWQLAHPQPGIYRVELWAQLPQVLGRPRAVPVLLSNKIFVTA